MKIKNLLILGLCASFVFTACDKDDDDNNGNGTDPFEAEYSDLSASENKENLEQTGIDMLDEVDGLKDAEAIDVMINFMDETDGTMPTMKANPFAGPIFKLAEANSDDFEVAEMFSELKSASEEPNSLTELWEELEGKYSWNTTTYEWDYSELSDAIVFEFPGMEEDVTNTASITINNFDTYLLTDLHEDIESELEGITPEILTSLNVSLKYETTEISSWSYSGSFQNNGIPTSLATELIIADFSWLVELSNTPYTEASLLGSFKHSDNVLIETFIEAEGNWSIDNIEDNIVEETETYSDGFGTYTETWTEVYIENIIENSNAYIQLMDIKIAGAVDIKSLGTDIRAIDEQYPDPWNTEETEAYANATAAAFNEHAQFIVVYAEGNEMIAEAEMYAVYNEEWDEWYTDIRFIFADESIVDAETYFSEGFDDLIDAFEDFIDDVNDLYEIDL